MWSGPCVNVGCFVHWAAILVMLEILNFLIFIFGFYLSILSISLKQLLTVHHISFKFVKCVRPYTILLNYDIHWGLAISFKLNSLVISSIKSQKENRT